MAELKNYKAVSYIDIRNKTCNVSELNTITLFHYLWTSSVGTEEYDKQAWQELENV